MKILLIANYEPDGQQSMLRFCSLLAAGLIKAGQDVRVSRPRCVAGRFGFTASAAKWLGYIDKMLLYPRRLRREAAWADVVHICDHSNAFYARCLGSVPHLITCHDLFAIQSALGQIASQPTRWSGRKLQAMIWRNLQGVANIVCVSEATRQEVLALLPESDGRSVSVVYNGLNTGYSPMDPEEANRRVAQLTGEAPPGRFVLHVGNNYWYKNRVGVLRIFDQLRAQAGCEDVRLIMVGSPWTDEIRRFVREHALADCVSQIVNICDEDLRALYSSARMLLFPSLREGFGWPIVEAQACGCPVVASNRAPMTEIGGAAAVYIDPDDPAAAAQAMANQLSQPFLSRVDALANAARFTRERMVDGYLSLYLRLCKMPVVSETVLSSPGSDRDEYSIA